MTGPKLCPQCGTEYPAEQRFCPTDGATLVAEQQDGLIGQIIADRYLILQPLGEGGMGQVYIAEHVRMQRRCALKVMHREMARDADAVSRFNREAANASRIQHPNVAAIYDFGEAGDGMLYIAMELVDGDPLSSVVEHHGGIAPRRAAKIIRQTADALAVAHHLGIVHRDLKPDNIMLGRQLDGSDMVKLLDFGIAKSAALPAQKVTRTGFIVGTPDYMSPEQMSGDAVDSRSDIYSLALVAVYAFTAQLPFDRLSSRSALVARLADAPRALAELRPEVAWPPALQQVLSRGLEPDPAKRYQKVEEFGRELMEAVNDAPGLDVDVMGDARTQVMSPTPRPEAPTEIMQSGAVTVAPKRGAVKVAVYATAGAVVLAGGFFAANSLRSNAAGPVTPPTQSGSPAKKDTVPATSTSTAKKTAQTSGPTTAPKPKADPAALANAQAAIRRELAAAASSARNERYTEAYASLSQANARLSAEERSAPGEPELAKVRSEYRTALEDVNRKCDATAQANRQVGEPVPTCRIPP